jgi:glycosyltransferase involved in cell wall biosynthesis
MRYLWDFYHQYKDRSTVAFWSRPFFTCVSHYMRLWDAASANRVDYFVANSRNVAARIRKHYRRDATVIYPPVNVGAGYLAKEIEDYYLVVGQLVDYKRIDLAIIACNQLRRRLRIVGDGEQFARLRKLAGPTIQFCGALSDEALHQQYAHCRALVFPGEEDFGIVPVEAQSFGRPVIAYGRGGVAETVTNCSDGSDLSPENSTGVLFAQQSWESLAAAIQKFEAAELRFHPTFIKQQADRFAPHYFRQNLGKYLSDKWREFRGDS